MIEGLQEMSQLNIEAGEALRAAIPADNEDEDKEVTPTSQPWNKGVININMEQAEPPYNRLPKLRLGLLVPTPTRNSPVTTQPSPPPALKVKQQVQKKPSVTFMPSPPCAQESSSDPKAEPKPMSYVQASTNLSNKPKSDAGHIAAAIKKGTLPKVLDETKGLRYLVCFSDIPHMCPDTPSLCALLHDTLATNNKTLENTPAKVIDAIIPLLMKAIEAPMTTFGIKKKWYHIIIPKCPTGLTTPGCTQAYSKGKLLQITWEAFSHVKGANFNSIKLTLMPDWITDPLLIQAQNRPMLAIAFSFKDPGQKVSECLLSKPNIIINGIQTTLKQFVPKPILTVCLRCAKYGHLTNNCRSKSH
ncbi:hypothetical protein OPQ81_003874 [Rhizoctonia solani]|nr:hypothetical protein OPQ81_003874 [Rhizoctonia solani]